MLSMERTRKLEIATASVRKFAQAGSTGKAASLIAKFRAADIAVILEGLGATTRLDVWKAFRHLEARRAADVLSEMPDESATKILVQLSSAEIGGLFRLVPLDDAAHLVSLLPDEFLDSLQEDDNVETTISPELKGHLAYPDHTAGRLMSTGHFALSESVTVGDAIEAVQKRSSEFEAVLYLYVVDERSHLIGVVSLRQLLLSASSVPLRSIMATDVMSVRTDADQEDVAEMIARYDILALPVVDADNRLVGVITVDDAIDILREEATEDIFALAGVAPEEHVTGGTMRAIRLRFPWLCINLLTTIVPTLVVSLFDDTIKYAVVPLAALMPIVAGMGGNAGTQAFTVVIRGIALNQMLGTSTGRVLSKEALVGLGNGLGNGLLVATAYALFFHNAFVGLALGLAMVTNMVVAGVAGTLVPLGLKSLNIDPAVASSVIVTTCTDAFGYGTFLGLSTLFLAYLR